MTDWKAIGLGAIINSVLTLVLLLAFFPLFFLGTLIGGFLTAYLSRGYEGYPTMDEKDGAVEGGISGVIGGIIIGLLFILGFGALSAVIGLIFAKVGLVAGTITIILGLGLILFIKMSGGVHFHRK